MTSPLLTSTPGVARWRQALRQARLPVDRRWRFATEIHRFLRYCEILQVPPSRARPEARLALRWFFQLTRRPTPARPPRPEPWWERARGQAHPNGTWYAPLDDEEPDGGAMPQAAER
jgi:hypothetical protein